MCSMDIQVRVRYTSRDNGLLCCALLLLANLEMHLTSNMNHLYAAWLGCHRISETTIFDSLCFVFY